MHKLLERAIAEAASLPEDRQEELAARILEEVRRHDRPRGRWAGVAARLARLDALAGRSEAFRRSTRELRDGFRLREPPAG